MVLNIGREIDALEQMMIGVRDLHRSCASPYEKCGVILQTILQPVELKEFQVLPKRWIDERIFGWLNHHRRLYKDYERLIDTSEAAIQIAMIDLMSRRLAQA